MHLYDLPIIIVLIGLVLYVILGGADFGAGLWQLITFLPRRRRPGSAQRAEQIREQAHESMGPVWEANHVWLIFVLTVTWTAYPRAFGAIASTLAVPLLIAAVGIVFRGAAYALRAGAGNAREQARIDGVLAVSSLITPFALGAIIGAIVLQRVPVGNAAGGLVSSWTAPFCLLLGALTVLLCSYMAAVYLAADTAREGDQVLADAFRSRALVSAALAGGLALVLLPVLHADAHHFYVRLVRGPGLIGVLLSAAAGVGTLALVITRRYELARVSAAIAVAGLIIGWALAQQPVLLPGLTVAQAAAPDQSLIALLGAILAGAIVLFPSLGFLFSLHLRGRFTASAQPVRTRPEPGAALGSARKGLTARLALATFILGLAFLTAADAPWAHIIGVLSFIACGGLAVAAVGPARLAEDSPAAGSDLPNGSSLDA